MSNNEVASAHLLSIPPEVRNTILELALLRSGMKKAHTTTGSQPAILRVCKQIRTEAISLYYTHNKFCLCIHDCDVRPIMGFKTAAWEHYSPPPRNLRPANFQSTHGIVCMRIFGNFVFENLVEWCRLVYVGEMFGVPELEDLGLLFDYVEKAKKKGSSWEKVERGIRNMRQDIYEWFLKSRHSE